MENKRKIQDPVGYVQIYEACKENPRVITITDEEGGRSRKRLEREFAVKLKKPPDKNAEKGIGRNQREKPPDKMSQRREVGKNRKRKKHPDKLIDYPVKLNSEVWKSIKSIMKELIGESEWNICISAKVGLGLNWQSNADKTGVGLLFEHKGKKFAVRHSFPAGRFDSDAREAVKKGKYVAAIIVFDLICLCNFDETGVGLLLEHKGKKITEKYSSPAGEFNNETKEILLLGSSLLERSIESLYVRGSIIMMNKRNDLLQETISTEDVQLAGIEGSNREAVMKDNLDVVRASQVALGTWFGVALQEKSFSSISNETLCLGKKRKFKLSCIREIFPPTALSRDVRTDDKEKRWLKVKLERKSMTIDSMDKRPPDKW
jgi:hypothetical protein